MHRFTPLTVLASAGVVTAVAAAGTVAGSAAAGDDATRGRGHSGSCHAEKATVRDVPQRIVPTWANEDADAFARVFTTDPSMIIPGQDTYLRSRHEIRAYMRKIFAEYPPVRVTAKPLSVRCLSRDVGVVVTEGGMMFEHETVVPPERVGRQTWTIVRQGRDWYVAAYQNSRITS
jgi:uncharacterized protein (TIGR02246 family)